jgi:hypothetical protein
MLLVEHHAPPGIRIDGLANTSTWPTRISPEKLPGFDRTALWNIADKGVAQLSAARFRMPVTIEMMGLDPCKRVAPFQAARFSRVGFSADRQHGVVVVYFYSANSMELAGRRIEKVAGRWKLGKTYFTESIDDLCHI